MSATAGLILGVVVLLGGAVALVACHAGRRSSEPREEFGAHGHVTITSAPTSQPTYDPVLDLEPARPGLGLPLGPGDAAEFATT